MINTDWKFVNGIDSIWVIILGGIFAQILSYGTDQAVVQRYLTTSTEKEAAKAISKTRKAVDSEAPKKKIWTATEISKLKPHEFEKFEKEIDLARLEGRIEQR